MARNLILVEFKEEAEFFLKNRPEVFKGDVKVLSLLPEASEVLLREKIPFETSTGYFSKTSHEECLDYVDGVIKEINRLVRVTDEAGVQHTYVNALTFYLRQYMGYVVMMIEVLTNVVRTHNIGKIHACRYENLDHTQFGLMSKERILGNIVRLLKSPAAVELHDLPVPDRVKTNHVRKFLRGCFCGLVFPFELQRFKGKKTDAFVFYTLKYYFDHIARAFKDVDHYNTAPDVKSFSRLVDRSYGFDLYNVHIGSPGWRDDRKLKESWLNSVEALKKARLFSWRGCDFSSVVFAKVEHGYAGEFKKLNRQIADYKKFLNVRKPKVVLSHGARDFSYAMGEVATLMNIPSLLISHGSHVPAKNCFDHMEWYDHSKGLVHSDYMYHLLQSPWAVEHVRAMGYQGNYYAVDPLIFPKVDRSGKTALQLKMFPTSQGRKIVVHAGTPKPRGSNRFYIYETLDEYIAYISDLVEEARNIPEIFLIIRFRPHPYLSTAQLRALLPRGDHYVIATEGPFADYLKIADLMVSFSSTTIEEALINEIPVLQYDPSGRYVHIEGAGWKDKAFAHVDSVYYIGERSVLQPGLKWIVGNHLNATIIGNLFGRHTFKPGEAVSVQEFLSRLMDGSLPKPINLKEKKHLDGVEIF
ncbi:MAG: hypothetical protein KA403_05425 [Candidatus Omnitrophica bacterium]|nr:hypothetical protein [Candidatus Omnitrophota bacterium]